MRTEHGEIRAALLIFVLSTLLVLFGLWAIIAIYGGGTWEIWEWNESSWQAIATGLTGLALGLFAYLTWHSQHVQHRTSTVRDLLIDGLSIFALDEAWIVDGGDASVILSEREPRYVAYRGPGHMRNVALRTVLDEGKWNVPEDDYFGMMGAQRAWIVRDRQNSEQSYQTGQDSGPYPPSVVSSRVRAELPAWVERVALADRERYLAGNAKKTLRPFLAALAQSDRREVLKRWGLTDDALLFLESWANENSGSKMVL